MWPPHPNPHPSKEFSLNEVPIVGERGQNPAAGYFCDAHTLPRSWNHRCRKELSYNDLLPRRVIQIST